VVDIFIKKSQHIKAFYTPQEVCDETGIAWTDLLKLSRSGTHRRPRGAPYHEGVLLFERGEAVHSSKGGICDEPSSQRLDRIHDFLAHAGLGGRFRWNVSWDRVDLLHDHRRDPDLRCV